MKISLKWLGEYVDISSLMAKPDGLAAKLTAAGIEVEGIENKREIYKNVVIGVILKKDVHPNADKLTVCSVSTGEGVVHQIVCGAKNHTADDRVIVALPGAVLPGDFAIKHSAIRGVESGGMLCSYKELGISQDGEGIAILDSKAPIGKPFAEYAGYDDVVFELKVTPNRSDCLSHLGLAREVATLYSLPVKIPNVEFAKSESSTKKEIQLQVDDSTLCPRYCGRDIKGVK
ncbi:MAG: YtpR family tRNA-binding protein, partial [Pseudobdellovibrionaceae bacterium]